MGFDVIRFETRDDDLDTAKLVPTATLGPFDSLPAQAQFGAAGRARWDGQPDCPLQRWDIDLRTEHSLTQRERQNQLHVVPIAAQMEIRLHHDVQVKVTRLA
jgi:hypothetical protein